MGARAFGAVLVSFLVLGGACSKAGTSAEPPREPETSTDQAPEEVVDTAPPAASDDPSSVAVTPTPIPAWDHTADGSGYRCEPAAGSKPTPLPALPTKGNNAFVIRTAPCKPARGHLALPLGSFSVEVEGMNAGRCSILVTNEMEGGYTTQRCTLPRSKRKTVLRPNESVGTCTTIESGNVHEDMAAALATAIPSYPIEGTTFTFGMREDEAGEGTAIGNTGLVTVEYQLFEDKEFATAATCPRCAGRLTLDVSAESGLGLGVHQALQSRGAQRDSPFTVGGSRSVILREETAAGLREHLPGMPPQAQLCVQLTLTAVHPSP